MNIAVYAPNWIGDAVMGLPFINACRAADPDMHLTVVAKDWVAPVYMGHPAVNRTIPLDRSALRGFAKTTQTGRSLARHG
ncbi:glycosyltransferase family 9 protein, partial [Candidatus Neomarinimicrobiota bacterium]